MRGAPAGARQRQPRIWWWVFSAPWKLCGRRLWFGELLHETVEVRFVAAILLDAKYFILLLRECEGDGVGDFALVLEDFLLVELEKGIELAGPVPHFHRATPAGL